MTPSPAQPFVQFGGVATIAPEIDFARAFVKGLWDLAGGDPLRLTAMQVLLPTRRACRHVRDAFAQLGQATLLPRLQPLGDVDEDELGFFGDEGGLAAGEDNAALPPALSPLRRQMMLARLVQKKDPNLSLDQAALLAAALARLLDEAAINDRDLRDLAGLVKDQELAAHWQETVMFLDIVTQQWPLILAAQGALDATTRRARLMRRQAALWQACPPDHPVIVAGSTGSVPATAELIATIAQLPQGLVVLPGLDQAMPESAWEALDETHPQFGMKNLLSVMKVPRDAVAPWPYAVGAEPVTGGHRTRLLAASMLPAAVTEAWRHLSRDDYPPQALTGLTRLELDNQEEEAAVIALRLRAALEQPQQTAALITADRGLAERVAGALERWGIVADDSAGSSLAHQRPGSFLTHIIEASSPRLSPVAMLTLLKHPLAAAGLSPAQCRARARAIEMTLWRTDQERKADDPTPTEKSWLDEFNAQLQPLRATWSQPAPLAEWIARHRAVAEALATTDNEAGEHRLWRGAAGEKTALWLDDWRDAGRELAPMTGDDYAALFPLMLRQTRFRPPYGQHPRLSVLGPLEARLIHADVMILGGMNEGVWPGESAVDPWMSRPMKRDFGLPLPEQRVGLAAHDFAQLAAAPVVMITRARRDGTSPTVPSRFLLQLDAVLTALGYQDQEGRDPLAPAEPWAAWARALDEPDAATIQPMMPPAPCPPLAARPTSLSVTRIGEWIRNPYMIYARSILRLRKLDSLEKDVDAAERGTMLHAALEDFVRRYPKDLPSDAEEQLLAIGAAHFAAQHEHPQVQAIWWPRFKKLAAWFVDQERARRTVGAIPYAVEAKGELVLGAGTQAPFTLTGRADRIDRLASGDLALIDYKSGYAPSKTSIEAGLEPQLPLLALMAARGGFAAASVPPLTTDEIAYWKIGGRTGGEATPIKTDVTALMEEAEAGLLALIAVYHDPAMPYLAVPRPSLAPRYDDYAHLARRAEWGHVTGGEG